MTDDMNRLRYSATERSGSRSRRLRLSVEALFLVALLAIALLVAYMISAPGTSPSRLPCLGSHCDRGFGSGDVVFVVYYVTNGHIEYFVSTGPAWANDYIDMWNRPRNETGLPTDNAVLNVTGDPNWRTCHDDYLNGQMDLWIVDSTTLRLTRTR